MGYQRSAIKAVFLWCAACVLAACSGNSLVLNKNVTGMPDWVIDGSRTLKKDERRLVHGVKMASLADLSLQRPFVTHENNVHLMRVSPRGDVFPTPQPNNPHNDLPPISSATLGNISAQGPAADERARQEVARILSALMKTIANEYVASGVKGIGKEEIARQAGVMAAEMLKTVRIANRWRDEKSNFLYSLAELDVDQGKEMLRRAEGLNADFQHHAESQMDNVFDLMAAKGGK
ncbi:MAG: hypothetical protein IDH49_10575 [Gammaproteobacteria bacterium]|nr:hypothetical protein [Gammaproteobacteria bacterium]